MNRELPDNRIEAFKLNAKTFPSQIPLKGKKPIEEAWQKWCEEKRPFNPEEFKGRNAGIPCGPANGIIVVDLDHIVKGNAYLNERGWKLPFTRTHETGTGKPHFLYQYPQNGYKYGNRSVKDPAGERDPKTGIVITLFDVRGIGGQVVAPGSIHPDTGKPYTVRHDEPIAPAPQWLLDFSRQEEAPTLATTEAPRTEASTDGLLKSLYYGTRRLIEKGETTGQRSEAIMSVLNSLVRQGVDDGTIIQIFEAHPQGIGQKFFEAGSTRETWLLKQIQKVRTSRTTSPKDVAALAEQGDRSRPEEPMYESSSRGAPTMADLRLHIDLSVRAGQPFTAEEVCRGLGAYSKEHRQNIYVYLARLVQEGTIRKDKYRHGGYRRTLEAPAYKLDGPVDGPRIFTIDLPLEMHNILKIEPDQLIGISGRYDAGKSSYLYDTMVRNYETMKVVHFSSAEWSLEAIKARLDELGIPRPHPNVTCYPMQEGYEDLIPPEPCIVLVDYLRTNDSPYEIDRQFHRIFENLHGGVALCAIQKHPGIDKPTGGQFAVHAPHHVILLDKTKKGHICKVFKTKSEKNIEGLYRSFSFTSQTRQLISSHDWVKGEIMWEKPKNDSPK